MVKDVAENLWVYERPLKRLGFDLGSRSTFVRAGGGLVLLSPLPFRDTGFVDALGPVRHIVAPSKYHYLSAQEARERWPGAKLWAAPGLAEKRPDLRPDAVLADGAALPDLDCHVVGGIPALNEVVFRHRPSRTVILFDLFFNITSTNLMTRSYLRITRAYRRPASSLLLRYFVNDRAALRASVDRVLAWDFDRVVVAHGDNILAGGKRAFASAMEWV